MPNYKSGFIALISVLLFSIIISIGVLSINEMLYNMQQNISLVENKERSFLLATSCAEQIRLLASQYLAIPSPVISTESGSCSLSKSIENQTSFQILITAEVEHATTHIFINIEKNGFNYSLFQEVKNL